MLLTYCSDREPATRILLTPATITACLTAVDDSTRPQGEGLSGIAMPMSEWDANIHEQEIPVAVPEESTPGESRSNGLAERAVQTVEDQLSTLNSLSYAKVSVGRAGTVNAECPPQCPYPEAAHTLCPSPSSVDTTRFQPANLPTLPSSRSQTSASGIEHITLFAGRTTPLPSLDFVPPLPAPLTGPDPPLPTPLPGPDRPNDQPTSLPWVPVVQSTSLPRVPIVRSTSLPWGPVLQPTSLPWVQILQTSRATEHFPTRKSLPDRPNKFVK